MLMYHHLLNMTHAVWCLAACREFSGLIAGRGGAVPCFHHKVGHLFHFRWRESRAGGEDKRERGTEKEREREEKGRQHRAKR